MLSKLDKSIIGLISHDIPLVNEPFKRLASNLGIEERILLERLKSYREKGLMRKFSAAVNHKMIGFSHNAMIVWNFPRGSLNDAANLMAGFSEVTHCYRRKKAPGWNYNLYCMVHGKNKKECLDVARRISKKTGGENYRLLFSSAEFKKTAAKYFKEKDE